MSYKIESAIKLSDIYLDNKNPRHDPIENEKDIISLLLKKEGVKPLARHIAMNGGLSPLELVALAPHATVEGAFIPAEGNRRMCALKLLADPDRAETETDRKFFRALSEEMLAPIKTIQAIIFKDKKSARPWVSLRHEGTQGGVGTLTWSPGQKSRFNMDAEKPNNPNNQAVLLLDYAKANNLLPEADLAKVSITTLTRFLTNPVFRDALGLVTNRDLQISVPAPEFNRAVTRFLADSITKDSGVDSRTSASDRKDYAQKLREDGDAPNTRGQTPVDASTLSPSTAEGQSTTETHPPKKPKRNNPSRDNDKYVIPRDFKATIKKNTVLKRVYDELYDLPADDFPFSAAFLTRAVIEQSTVLYLRQKGKTPPKELHQKLLALAEILSSEGMTDTELKSLRTMGSTRDDRSSADTLGAFVHGGVIPSKHDCIRTWDSLQNVLTKVFAGIK